MSRLLTILLLYLSTLGAQSQAYDSLAASDTLNWAQMQYLDSLVQYGARWQEYTDKLMELGVVKQVQEAIDKVPEHVQKLDSLLEVKAARVNQEISRLLGQARDDSLGIQVIPRFARDDLTMNELDALIGQYSSELTSAEEISWLQDHVGQLNQLQGSLQQYQGKLLELADLQQLQGYQQQVQQLMGQSQGYFQEAKGLFSGGLSEGSLPAGQAGPLMQELQSKIGLSKEFQELQAKTAELEQFKALSKKYGEDYARKVKEMDRQRMLDLAQEIGAQAFEEHQEKVQKVQGEFQKLKKKYSKLADARDLSTGVKRNTLKEEPFKKRLMWGGTFQINPSYTKGGSLQNAFEQPTSLDFSPILGYRINKLFRAGVGGIYRAQLEVDEFQADHQVYGWRSYLEYMPIESFYLHGEYEAMNNTVATPNVTSETSRQWTRGALFGIGKEYPLFKGVKGQVMVLYNFLHEFGETPYEKPFVIRFGVTN